MRKQHQALRRTLMFGSTRWRSIVVGADYSIGDGSGTIQNTESSESQPMAARHDHLHLVSHLIIC